MKILFTMPIPEDLQEKQKAQFPDNTYHYIEDIRACDTLSEINCIVSYGSDITEEVLERATNLRWLMVFSAGIEELPHAKLQEKNITVTNVRGIHAIPMAEFAFSYMLSYVKQLPHFAAKQQEHQWGRADHQISELANQTLIIVGTGAIGTQVAHLAKAFQMEVIGINTTGKQKAPFDKTVQTTDITTVLPEGDFIISILPETNATKGFYQKRHFQTMKKSAVFINIGRGSAITEEVLVDIAKQQTIAHMYLDVTPIEPLPENHALWSFPNVTITPHVSAHSPRYLYRSFDIWLENLERFQKQEPLLNTRQLDRGY
ncbi:D-2-hydroxyacid dehydrogenase [Listeria booriae]|uniref:D-2-hydroxyacid dehydrogenase n=1 Tax=Listeria booriae TaxID=1552123 RepID=A0A841Y2F6_9LIST|nr:D-2-hydroxyacid dehydrogenase [Listeria booriae]MBC1318201.1 D-2-hydroxyacid dehydrogenase [Listeria booriae]